MILNSYVNVAINLRMSSCLITTLHTLSKGLYLLAFRRRAITITNTKLSDFLMAWLSKSDQSRCSHTSIDQDQPFLCLVETCRRHALTKPSDFITWLYPITLPCQKQMFLYTSNKNQPFFFAWLKLLYCEALPKLWMSFTYSTPDWECCGRLDNVEWGDQLFYATDFLWQWLIWVIRILSWGRRNPEWDI